MALRSRGIKFKKSHLGFLIDGANKKIRRSSKVRHNGRLFNRPEDVIHYEAVQMLINEFPNVQFISNILDSVRLHIRTKAQYKGLRNKKGTIDLFVMKPNRGFCGMAIDFKTEDGRATKEQEEFLAQARLDNYFTHLGEGLRDSLGMIRWYLSQEDKCK
jgi:hypothetical protein